MVSAFETADQSKQLDFSRTLERKRREIVAQSSRVLETRHSIDKLRERQVEAKDAWMNAQKFHKWKRAFDTVKLPDKSKRPPDKTMPVRAYTLIDNDVWQEEGLRGWFQTYAPEHRPRFDGTLPPGYMQATSYLQSAGPRRAAASAQAAPAPAAQAALPRDKHWMDFQGNVDMQRTTSTQRLERGLAQRPMLAPEQGHVDGFRRAPWKSRPGEEMPGYIPREELKRREALCQTLPGKHWMEQG